METLAFGPVPSRRLGKSLGINNIPAKNCTYSCIYCQLGRTLNMMVERKAFYKPEEILKEVERKVKEATSRNERIDYLTFVPDGEPTLDINLGEEINLLKQIGIPVAVITNASLLWLEDVEKDLMDADLVSLKVDAVSEDLWRRINRPHKSLSLSKILGGVSNFTREFNHKIITETMLVEGVEYAGEFEKIAEFLKDLRSLDKALSLIHI